MNGTIVCSSDSLYQFDQPSLGLPSRDYYACTGPYEEVRLACYINAAIKQEYELSMKLYVTEWKVTTFTPINDVEDSKVICLTGS